MPIRQSVFVGSTPMPIVVVVLLVLAAGLAGCGGGTSEPALSGDAGSDSSADGNGFDGGFQTGDGGGSNDAIGAMGDAALAPDVFGGSAGGSCLKLGGGCATNADCCDGDCSNGLCSYPACASDHQACTSNGQCCSQSCVGGTCAPEFVLLDRRQPVHFRCSVLLGQLRGRRHVPAVVLLRTGRRRVRDGRRLLQRPVHDGHQPGARNVLHVATRWPGQLRNCRRCALRRLGDRRRRRLRRRRPAAMRRRVLQQGVCSLRADGSPRLPAGERLPCRRRPLRAGQ